MAIITDIADLIVEGLGAGGFSVSFDVERAYVPIKSLKDLAATTYITVVPKNQDISMADRNNDKRFLRIDLGVQKKVASDSDAEIDVLMTLVDELVLFFNENREYGTAFWVATENDPIYSPEHLVEDRVFFSKLTLTFMVIG